MLLTRYDSRGELWYNELDHRESLIKIFRIQFLFLYSDYSKHYVIFDLELNFKFFENLESLSLSTYHQT